MRRTIGASIAILSVCLVAWAQRAEAHILVGEATGFFSGVLHPISGLLHQRCPRKTYALASDAPPASNATQKIRSHSASVPRARPCPRPMR
jgi:hypothetical protein